MSKERLEKITGGSLKETVPVSGVVTLDGNPEEGIVILLYPKTAGDGTDPISQVRTDVGGKYCWSTYSNCDGVVPGEYKLLFKNMPKVNKAGEGKDLFNGRYANLKKPEFTLTVGSESPQEDVDYELKSK